MAGFREEIPAYTLMMQCGSSLPSVNCAANDIRCGDVDVAVAGGVEAMSATNFELWNARYGYGTGNNVLVDPIVEGAKRAQPQETYGVFGMGDTAENVAEQFHISREDMDEFAFHSQRKAAEAVAAGVFKDEIVPVMIPQRKKEPIVFDTDEQPRATTMEGLAKLKPVFRTDGKGKVTAGNSCGRSDAGAALLLMSGEKVKELGVEAQYGAIDISLYRDDIFKLEARPSLRSSNLPFSTDDMRVVLVDDVLYTGRTVRAALNALFDYGRPARIELACLIDRGGREVPIQPDYTGHVLDHAGAKVIVSMKEADGEDRVIISSH
ncbi:MAG: bifunctional pyr operon transcriptional regulator/uracil phosphoribosyltransferase PyrR [Akkermansia muciniphila]|nr:bifunctional pyr operon transcriptional regulator/uracil phosphoribosyltransferase PyrR [Akkermansia muciniphila]